MFNRRFAEEHLAWLRTSFDDGQCLPYQVAMVCVRIGRVDDVFDWLGRAAELRDFNFVCTPVDPAFDALHDDAPWVPMLDRSGFGHLRSDGAPPGHRGDRGFARARIDVEKLRNPAVPLARVLAYNRS